MDDESPAHDGEDGGAALALPPALEKLLLPPTVAVAGRRSRPRSVLRLSRVLVLPAAADAVSSWYDLSDRSVERRLSSCSSRRCLFEDRGFMRFGEEVWLRVSKLVDTSIMLLNTFQTCPSCFNHTDLHYTRSVYRRSDGDTNFCPPQDIN